MLRILLYFISDKFEPDTWDIHFVRSFQNVINQLIGNNIELKSNIELDNLEKVSLDKMKTQEFDIYILINNDNQVSNFLPDEPGLLNISINLENIDRYFLIQKFPKHEQFKIHSHYTLRNYPFFEMNHRSLQFVRFNPEVPGDSEDGFWSRISDLGFDIKYLVNKNSNRTIKSELSIFLAETAKDQIKNYEKIKRELQLAGFNILPVVPMPRQINEFEQCVADYLAKSVLSINILGELYGDNPEDSDYSYVELQNRVYDRFFNDSQTENSEPCIQRIIWAPPVLEFTEDKQSQYLKRFKKDPLYKTRTEYVQSSISELIKIIESKLSHICSDEFELIGEKELKTKFFIISDINELNKDSYSDIEKKHKITVQTMSMQSAEFKNTPALMDLFKAGNGFVLVNAKQNNTWTQSILNYIIRSKGYTDSIPTISIGVFSGKKSSINYQSLPYEIKEYQLNTTDFKNQLESHISKLKL